jgi:hypothetical protein
MKQSNKIAILFIALILVSIVVFLGSKTSGTNEQKVTENNEEKIVKKAAKYKTKNWSKTYNLKDHNAFDIYIFDQLLDAQNKAQKKIVETENDFNKVCNDSASLYLFIGDHFAMKQTDLNKIIASVRQGSTFFLSHSSFSKNIDSLVAAQDIVPLFIYTDKVTVSMNEYNNDFYTVYQNDTIADLWSVLNFFNDDEVLSRLNGYANTIRVRVGKGQIIINSTPILLTNYYLEKEKGFQYYNLITKDLPKYKKVWLELPKTTVLKNDYDPLQTPHSKKSPDKRKKKQGNSGVKNEDSELLRMIFSSRSLTFAYLLTILGVLLFLLFRTKRMRPQVKVLAEEIDGTKNFTETLAQIYQTKSEPKAMVLLLKENFYTQIKRTFNIDLNDANEETIQNLAEISNSSLEEIKELIYLFNADKWVSNEYLVDLAEKKRNFYLKAGMIANKYVEKTNSDFVLRRAILIPSIVLLISSLLLLLGLYCLAAKIGVGIVVIGLAFAGLYISLRWLNQAVLTLKNNKLTFLYTFKKSVIYSLDDLIRYSETAQLAQFQFADQTIALSKVNIAKIDIHLLQLFFTKTKTL